MNSDGLSLHVIHLEMIDIHYIQTTMSN